MLILRWIERQANSVYNNQASIVVDYDCDFDLQNQFFYVCENINIST